MSVVTTIRFSEYRGLRLAIHRIVLSERESLAQFPDIS